jgi:hypothetical protein
VTSENESESVALLYLKLAEDRAVQSSRRLLRLPVDQQFAAAARALTQAAGALAVITTFYTHPGSEISDKFDGQVQELIALAASLEHTADGAPPSPDRRTC